MQFSASAYQIAPRMMTFKTTIERVAEAMQTLVTSVGFDAIAFTGSSGACIAYPVSYITGIPLIYVRKDGESTHGEPIEAEGDFNKYIILDDFVCSGSTIEHVYKRLDERNRLFTKKLRCLGVALYKEDMDSSEISAKLCRRLGIKKFPVYMV